MQAIVDEMSGVHVYLMDYFSLTCFNKISIQIFVNGHKDFCWTFSDTQNCIISVFETNIFRFLINSPRLHVY